MEFLAIYRDYVTLDMIWLGVAVLALVVKCFTREYVSLCVAIGALAAFVVSVTIFHGHLLYQVITAVAVAFILAIFIQPYAMHKNQEQRMREAREKLIPHKDEEGIVIEKISATKNSPPALPTECRWRWERRCTWWTTTATSCW